MAESMAYAVIVMLVGLVTATLAWRVRGLIRVPLGFIGVAGVLAGIWQVIASMAIPSWLRTTLHAVIILGAVVAISSLLVQPRTEDAAPRGR